MKCRKCGRSIPDSAQKCPYCYTKTTTGWKKEGEKLIEPVKNLLKNPFRK